MHDDGLFISMTDQSRIKRVWDEEKRQKKIIISIKIVRFLFFYGSIFLYDH